MAMNPLLRPITLTTPSPNGNPPASVSATLIASLAASTAVSKPKVLSSKGTSLSIVLGTTATAIARPRFFTSSAILAAPLTVPSPPTTNSKLTPCSTRESTMASVSWPPREVPKVVPPMLCRLATAFSSSSRQVDGSLKPRYPAGMPSVSVTPYWRRRHMTTSRMTVLRPGQRPPHVTIAALHSLGSNAISFRGPAKMNASEFKPRSPQISTSAISS
mmetsp:Transcript_7602/g.18100  ORF Transcript_7602/g.18100 Transcript_7602/m.18100 type:complete len:217 (+) Transcript_7602:254-904(+)